MEISQDMIRKITSMSDDELKKAIGEIADALGASGTQKRMAMSNAGFIKRKISKMSKAEMEAFISKMPPEKAQELKNSLGL